MKTSRLSIAAASLLVPIALFAPLSAQTPPADTTLATNPIFEKSCAKCHGEKAEGRHFHGPTLVSDKVAAASADDLNKIITNGKGHMPKFSDKLKPEEIDTLVQQIKALNKK